MRSPCCATGNIVRHDTVDHFRMEDLIEDIIGKGSNARFQYISRDEEILPELMLRVEDLGWHGNPNRISFDVKKGEVVGLVGLLGSGRTEIVETLFGIRQAERLPYLRGRSARAEPPTSPRRSQTASRSFRKTAADRV